MYDPAHPFGKKAHDEPIIHNELCVGCGLCAAHCVTACLHVQEDGFFAVDLENCIGCRACKVNCFWGAIEMVRPKESDT